MKTTKHSRHEGGEPVDKVEFSNEIVDLLDMDDLDRERAQRDIATRYGLSKGTVAKFYREAKYAHAKNAVAHDDASNVVGAVPDGSDQAVAMLFIEQYGDIVRRVAKLDLWLVFNGMRWENDDIGKVRELARKVCQEAAARFLTGDANVGFARSVASATKIDNILKIVQSDPKIAATHDQWDTDPMLLNTPAGVVDLRDGSIRPARTEDYLRKMTAVAPDGECPRFDDFFKQITGGSRRLRMYLQRAIGYMMTGRTDEQVAFFFFGVGANGKSVLLSTIAGMMGDYAATAPSSMLMAKAFESHPTEIARLQNVRLVECSEIDTGQKWAESRLKSLTGGDKITARFMRQDFFEFKPQFKLLIAANQRPSLTKVDEAIRRRLHMIPFDLVIPEEERIGDLDEILMKEWPGILAWAIRGCCEWQEGGLRPPEIVRAATAEYFESEDQVSAWLDECCVREPSAFTPIRRLSSDFNSWAGRNGTAQLRQSELSDILSQRGFRKARKAEGTGHHGIQLKPEDDSPAIIFSDERRRRLF